MTPRAHSGVPLSCKGQMPRAENASTQVLSGGRKHPAQGPDRQSGMEKKKKTYNTGDSLVVTDPTTNPAVAGLSRGERTGSRIFLRLWSYVLVGTWRAVHLEEEVRSDNGTVPLGRPVPV